MNKKIARALALVLAFAMLFSICACSKGSSDGDSSADSSPSSGKNNKDNKEEIKNDLNGVEKVRLEHVYKATPISIDMDENEYINRSNYVNGKLYMSSNYWDGHTEPDGTWVDDSGTRIYVYDFASGEFSLFADLKSKYEVPEQYKDIENTYYSEYASNHTIAEDGTIWFTKEIYFEDYSDPDNYVYEQSFKLVNAAADGTVNVEYELKADDENFYASRIEFSNGKLICPSGQNIYIFGEDMQPEATIKYNDNSYLNSYAFTENGDMIAIYYSWNEIDYSSSYTIVRIDIENKNIIELPNPDNINLAYVTFFGSNGDKIYYRNDSAIFEYDAVSGKSTEKLNWLNSDINSYRLGLVAPIEGDKFVISESTPDYSASNFYIMSPIGESEVVEKYTMTLAAVYPYDTIRDSILEFNKQSEEFRVVLKDYSLYNNEENWNAGLEKLNQDMIAGDIPDILIVDDLPFENYASKGLLADLSAFMKKDESFDRSDYLENIFESTTVDGKLYSIIPSFTVFTLVGRADVVGTEMGWTIEDLMNMRKEYPDAEVIAEETRGNVLRYFSSMAINSFVNYETGECKFNSPDFVKLLEFINTFPEEIDWDEFYENLPDDYWETYNDRFRDNRVLLMTSYVSYIEGIKNIEYELGGEATFVGFPCPDENGSSIRPEGEIAISSKTKLAGACWDFVKVMLSEQYQKNINYGFPVHKGVLEDMFTEATTAQDYSGGEEAVPLPADDIAVDDVVTGDLGYDDYWSKPVSQAQADKLMALLTSVTNVERENTDLLAIIEEEAGAYFAGQKSAQAVADAIQSRAWIYVSENS